MTKKQRKFAAIGLLFAAVIAAMAIAATLLYGVGETALATFAAAVGFAYLLAVPFLVLYAPTELDEEVE